MPERTLGIFAKAPVAGRVKTRLAAEIGSQAAAALYRRVGREVVAASVGRDHRTIVWFSPPAAGAAVHAWLDCWRRHPIFLFRHLAAQVTEIKVR